MTGICGLTGHNETQVYEAVQNMMAAMDGRGTVTHAITVRTASREWVGTGVCEQQSDLIKVHEEPVDNSLLVDGKFWEREEVARVIADHPRQLSKLITIPGCFSFLGIEDDGLVAGRDVLGQKPLYFSRDVTGELIFASLRKALVEVGFKDAKPVPPGELFPSRTLVHPRPGRLSKIAEGKIAEEDARERLGELLLESVSKMVREGSVVSFSGGIDSSLVASATAKLRAGTELVTVGLEGQPELEHAVNAARAMGLKVRTRSLAKTEVLQVLPYVIEAVETADPMIVSTALPFHFACLEAKKVGADTIVAGQLSDELFGGYARFERSAREGPLELVRDQMFRSVVDASTNDFEPGDKIAVSMGLELVCPFAYLPLAEYALSLPMSLKVRVGANGVVRKYILRKLAELWGLPPVVVNRPKKAFQYSTGVHRVLEQEAHGRGLSLGEFVGSFLASRQVYASATQ